MTVLTHQQAKKYFSASLLSGIAGAFILAAVGFIFIEQYVAVFLFALVAIILLYLDSKKKSTLTDLDIDETFESLVPIKELDALKALNMSKDQLVKKSSWYWCAPPEEYLKLGKLGKDKITRYRARTLLLILYGDKQIMTSETVCDVTADVKSSTVNSEWFYKDVVAVEVGIHENNSSLILKSAAGNKYFQLENQKSNIKLDAEKTNAIIASVREILREKKG